MVTTPHSHSSKTLFLQLSSLSGVFLVFSAGLALRHPEKAHGASSSLEAHPPPRAEHRDTMQA